ncbi:hypothetical protein KPC83_02335 [Collinsella sp. zg1085]|uniref:hypothetical protein n=1 Tax=Collinsella sp. zg1085 TaxID=2844380 RepID=UPI001C0CB216|nr:hypothetical protein [Collinsella sp. zg1085]QWT17996.1 hypothetical protein KPC83_02335 [Collinsella sp. zg1085]
MTASTQNPRTVSANSTSALDIKSLVLLAVLLAAGFILNFTVGKSIAALTANAISPEFIISAFCLTILVVRPNLVQALVIGLISAAVIQITTTSPFIDFAAEGIAAVIMALFVKAQSSGSKSLVIPAVGTFVTTAISGIIFMVIKLATTGFAPEMVAVLPAAMLPVIFATAAFNAVLVAALYLPIKAALKLEN